MSRRAPALAFLLAAAGVLLATLPFQRLYDTESYLHLALGKHLLEAGPRAPIPWARLSVLAGTFGDKELLFHAYLAPFAAWLSPLRGGLLAMALLTGLLAALLARVAGRFGRGAGWTPLLVLAGSADVALRLLRVRPEILSVILFVAALDAAARRRWRLLALLSLLYPLSYVAVPAYLGLFGILFVLLWWRDARPEWPLVLAPAAGVAAGLLLHPHPLAYLWIVKLNLVDVLKLRGVLDTGSELDPQTLKTELLLNAGCLLGLLVLWRARRPASDPAGPDAARHAIFFGTATAVFVWLTASMWRFGVYAAAFGTIALLAALHARGEEVGPRTALPFRGSLPTPLALALALAAGLVAGPLVVESLRAADVFTPDEAAEWRALRPLVPEGAHVASPWGNAETYAWSVPQGRYLNVFDPTLMAVPFPAAYRAQRAIWSGAEPDPAAASLDLLDSPYLLFRRSSSAGTLEARLLGDPRVTVLHRRENLLARVDGGRNGAFLLDWKSLPVPSALAVPPASDWAAAPAWPRARTPRARSVEGYVDALRLPGECRAFRHEVEVSGGAPAPFEFSPWGSGALFVDGRLVASAPAGTRAVLGKGLLLPLALAPGRHELVVTTCAVQGRSGFYLLSR